MLLRGGVVRTLDGARPLASGLLVRDGAVAALLDDDDAAPRDAERVELAGACVLPGFTDAHVHFPSWAVARGELRLFEARSLGEAVDAVRRAVGDVEPGGWLRGRGWRDELWGDGERPTRAALDAVAPDVPVALRAHDGHSLWVNSAALARAAGRLETPGGVVERDVAGEPSGILREQAAWRFLAAHAEPGHAETLAAMRAALPAAAAAGVTAVHDKDGGRGAPELFDALRAAGELTVRVWQSIPAERLGPEAAPLGDGPRGGGEAAPLGDGLPAPDEWLRVGYVKAFMDGTLGSRTALLLDGSGVRITGTAELADLIVRCARRGLPIAVHAIGDGANREALDAFAETVDEWRPRGLRHRVEHAQCVHPDDVARFAALGVAASVQFTHATSDRDLAERLWAERIERAYPYRSLLDAGVLLAGGSDAPVEELDPLAGLRAAVLRTLDERPPWRPEQALPPAAALAAFTTGPAWLAGEEERRGRLLPGFAADLVVLDGDPLAGPPEALAERRMLGTMVGGRWTYGPAV